MKCPKCGYLGFETTARCRNCGYDFSFAAPAPSAELQLRSSTPEAPFQDFALAEEERIGGPLDERELHDRDAAGFGRPEPRGAMELLPASTAQVAPEPVARAQAAEPAVDPAEDLPLFAPRPAGTPLGVRRPGNDVPRSRRTTTRPVRTEAPVLPLVMEAPEDNDPATEQAPTSGAPAPAGVVARLGAAIIDTVLLLSIDAAVLWLTLRLAGLQSTPEDLLVIRPVPMVGFFLVLAFLYLVGFTLGGGRTVGKMLTRIRVTGDDGRGVDITGAVVRALGSLVAVCTLGLLFIPALFSSERRAMHDRLAGTRVVIG